jgi:hypothetical protein
MELDGAPGGKEEFERLSTGSLRRSAVEGDVDSGSVLAGQTACFIQREESVAEIISGLFDGEKARSRMAEIAKEGFL